jgi:hypothetical protein
MAQFKDPIIEDTGEDDYRAYFDSSVFRVWHLEGKPRTYKITRVKRLESEFKGKTRLQPLLFLVDRDGVVPLPLALNKTNAKTVASLYGTKTSAWVGKLITLFPTTTDVGGKTEECIRIRNEDPSQRKAPNRNRQGAAVLKPEPSSAVEIEREPGDDEDDLDDEPPPGALETDDHASH